MFRLKSPNLGTGSGSGSDEGRFGYPLCFFETTRHAGMEGPANISWSKPRFYIIYLAFFGVLPIVLLHQIGININLLAPYSDVLSLCS